MNTILTGDCLTVMPTLPENSVDSIITDPPYGLDFMGKSWDHGVPGMEFWQAALRVAKPGAILMAFGGTRTYHRLTCAIEDAGWEIRDMMMFLYGSGFPKSLDISKQIDRRGGAQVAWFGSWFRQWRQGRGINQKDVAALFPSKTGGLTGCVANWELGLNMPTPEQFNLICSTYGLPFGSIEEAEREVLATKHDGGNRAVAILGTEPQDYDITAPSTPAAHLWQGWGTALKPAWEPIIVAMKPLEGTYAENAQKWGVAGLNIDGGRIGTSKDVPTSPKVVAPSGYTVSMPGGKMSDDGFNPNIGRWPANLLLDEEAARLLDEQSGVTASENRPRVSGSTFATGMDRIDMRVGHNDSGGASRFFYTAKASSSERNAGLEDMEAVKVETMNEYVRPSEGRTADKNGGPKQNFHPTVKPVSLMRYLCKLTRTPTGGVVLDPFMGSGTTGIACVLEHRDFIGIEIDEGYAEIARKRIADITGPLFVTA